MAATALDLAAKQIHLADGDRIGFDGLVIATGARARGLPGTEHLAGVHTLRTLDDALALREQVAGAGTRVVVVGAGFIGCEVAASCRARGASVTVVEPLEQPLARVLGPTVGAVVAAVHREHGVDVRLGVGVAAVEGDTQVRSVTLADGSTIDADVVVVGIGVVPDTGWLEGSGLTLVDGVVCDATTLAAPGVVAAGDVARWPNETFGELMRVEHWEHALDMGAHAARRLLTPDHEATPYAPVPWFWSDQYDRKIQMAGRVRPDDEMVVVAGSFEDRRFCALYGRDGRVVGALGMNMPARIVKLRTAIADGLRWDDALRDLTAGPP
jgi:NADPH-dependent 2,4-dienoyl-CoA reductase/sulfur reductase-like enzyme